MSFQSKISKAALEPTFYFQSSLLLVGVFYTGCRQYLGNGETLINFCHTNCSHSLPAPLTRVCQKSKIEC